MGLEQTLALHRVRKVFPGQGRQGEVVALAGIDLKVSRGEFVAIVGPSGCGKSTLIDLVAGFTLPTAGSVVANGRQVSGPGPDRVVVFQDHAIFPWYTALGNVAYGLRRQGVPRHGARSRAHEALARVGLGEFAHAYPATLSGGMRQRVALARALVLRPEILLLDEPFAALDSGTRFRLQDELAGLWQDFGWTVLFVTHTLDEAVYLADRVVVLDRSPAGVRAIESIDLPRPRDRRDPRLVRLSRRLDGRAEEPDEGEPQRPIPRKEEIS
jgi:NitT/TauT family transport system ATP-binding protein